MSRSVLAAVVLVMACAQAHAVILYRTSTRNTSAPTGTNYNSGWQWEGNWAGSFTGIPIASRYFITAGHVGGNVGDYMSIGGKSHKTTAVYDDPSTDLRIYKIADTFSSWAPIYTGWWESGKSAMIYGRGTQRGSGVYVGSTLKGWKWGSWDKVRSWGQNTVSGTAAGGSGIGSLLKFTFSRTGGLYNEGAISAGDSAGGVFVNDGRKWKLAGINYLVDGPFSLSYGGSTFNASLFDKGGLYVQNAKITDTSSDVPGNFYATRVTSRQSWIKAIIGTTSAYPAASSAATVAVPEPASVSVLAIGAAMLLRRRRRS